MAADALRFADDANNPRPTFPGVKPVLCRGLHGGKLFDRCGLEDAMAVQLAVVEKHLAEAGVVQAVEKSPPLAAGYRSRDVGDLPFRSETCASSSLPSRIFLVRLGHSLGLLFRQIKRVSFIPAARRCDHERIDRMIARNNLHNTPRGIDAGLAILPLASRFKLHGLSMKCGINSAKVRDDLLSWEWARSSRAVSEQLLNRKLAFLPSRSLRLAISGMYFSIGLIERELASSCMIMTARGDWFGHGGDPEDGIPSPWGFAG